MSVLKYSLGLILFTFVVSVSFYFITSFWIFGRPLALEEVSLLFCFTYICAINTAIFLHRKEFEDRRF